MKSMEFLPSTNFTLLNQIKGNSVMRFFFLKFVISVMGDQFLALGARSLAMSLVVSLSCILFLRTQMVKMYIRSGTDNLQNILCTDES